MNPPGCPSRMHGSLPASSMPWTRPAGVFFYQETSGLNSEVSSLDMTSVFLRTSSQESGALLRRSELMAPVIAAFWVILKSLCLSCPRHFPSWSRFQGSAPGFFREQIADTPSQTSKGAEAQMLNPSKFRVFRRVSGSKNFSLRVFSGAHSPCPTRRLEPHMKPYMCQANVGRFSVEYKLVDGG